LPWLLSAKFPILEGTTALKAYNNASFKNGEEMHIIRVEEQPIKG
jgi:hypothetical protein